MATSPLTFIPLGVGDAFTARYYSSCLFVEAEGAALLVDCPHPIRKMMCEASASSGVAIDVDRVSAVVLTHLHADHASGLEGFGYFSYFVLRQRARLLAHPDVTARLWDGHLAAGMGQLLVGKEPPPWEMQEKRLEDYFELLPLLGERAVQHGPFSIECRRTIHHVPTTALRIRAGGRCLAYSADTAFDGGLIDWLSDGDLIIHETNHGVHTPYERLVGLPEALRRRLRLIHYPDEFETEASAIEALVQGRRYEVTGSDARRS